MESDLNGRTMFDLVYSLLQNVRRGMTRGYWQQDGSSNVAKLAMRATPWYVCTAS